MARNLYKPLPGELHIRGVVNKEGVPSLQMFVGEGVPENHAKELFGYLNETRYSILDMPWYRGEHQPRQPFFQELAERDYDISTFRFSLFLRSAERKQLKRVQLIRCVPGLLHSRWARVEHDGPDICSAWGRPCRRADSALWQSLLSAGTCSHDRMLLMRQHEFPQDGLLGRLKKLGFDERTLRFSVNSKLPLHPDDMAPPPEARLKRLVPDSCPAFVETCPVCGAVDGQPCTEDDGGNTVTLVDKVHASRFEDFKPSRKTKSATTQAATAPAEAAET
jgi:hypothetical protein